MAIFTDGDLAVGSASGSVSFKVDECVSHVLKSEVRLLRNIDIEGGFTSILPKLHFVNVTDMRAQWRGHTAKRWDSMNSLPLIFLVVVGDM